MTSLTVLLHKVRYRHFKLFYEGYVCRFLRGAFPRLPLYSHCIPS